MFLFDDCVTNSTDYKGKKVYLNFVNLKVNFMIFRSDFHELLGVNVDMFARRSVLDFLASDVFPYLDLD